MTIVEGREKDRTGAAPIVTTQSAARSQAYKGPPIMTYHRGLYIVFCEHSHDGPVRQARFTWSGQRQYWYTREPVVAARLAHIADEIAQVALNDNQTDARSSFIASRATDSDLSIPAPPGLAYLPFQRAGIAYALQRPHTLIGDEMGLGKTIQAAGIINADETIKRVLVVTKATLKINWLRELDKWLVRPMIPVVLDDWFPASADVIITNYEQLHKFARPLRRQPWDLLVVDEAHFVKNPDARRSQQVYALPAKRRVFLTGSPIPNRPMELWALAHALAPHVFDDEIAYRNRYAAATNKTIAGALALRELNVKARMTFMIRRLKVDVLKDLPAKRRQVVELPAAAGAWAVEAEQNLSGQHAAALELLRVDLELAKVSDDEGDYSRALAALRQEAALAAGATSKVRHETALAKVPAVVDYVRNALEQVDQVVLFAHHHDVITAFVEQLPGAVKVDGTMTLKDRQSSIDAFQAGKARVFVGSIQAAGVGITLTNASNVFFAELDWTPGNISQAEDRCHRIGQKDTVNVYHLVFAGSMDATMAKRLVDKQAVIEAVLDGKLDDLEPDASDPLVPAVDETFATAHVSRARLLREAETIEPTPAGVGTLAGQVHPIDQALWMALNALEQTALRSAMRRRIEAKYTPKETS